MMQMTAFQTAAGAPPEIILVALLFVLVVASLRTRSYADVRVGNATVRAEVADNPVKQVAGLMGRGALADDEGMLFPLGSEGYPKFWMAGMRIPIDVIYIGKGMTVVDVKNGVRPCNAVWDCASFAPDGKAMYVLEVAAGFAGTHGVAVGSKAEISQINTNPE